MEPDKALSNCNKSVGGQLCIDVERLLNYELKGKSTKALTDHRGRQFLDQKSIKFISNGSAGQSFAAFCNDGFIFEHTGTCNDGVGKSSCGGEIVIKSPDDGGKKHRGGATLLFAYPSPTQLSA